MLARPISPGSIALLAEHATDPNVQKRLGEALKDPNPSVRGVASRVAFVTMSKGLMPAVIMTLGKEQDATAAAEEVRALMAFGGSGADDIVLRVVQRIGGPPAAVMAETLARTRGADLLKFLPALIAVNKSESGFPAALGVACAQNPASGEAIAESVLASSNPRLWAAFLETLHSSMTPAPPVALRHALASPNVLIQEATLYQLVASITDGDEVPEDVLSAAEATPEADAAGAQTAAGFAREILARARGRQPSATDWTAFLKRSWNNDSSLTVPNEAFAWFTKGEIAVARGASTDSNGRFVQSMARISQRKSAADDSRLQTMRTLPIFAAGLLTDLKAVTECKPPSDEFAAADAAYRPDGRVARMALLEVLQKRLSSQCQALVRGLMLLTVASPTRPVVADRTDFVVLPFESAFLACADAPAPAPPASVTTLASVAPRRRRAPPPFFYPAAAKRLGIYGTVMVQAAVSQTGCVRGAETTRTVHPILDIVALRHVIKWEFDPATIAGVPVEAVGRISVEFPRQ